jgi:O-acetyl-ADP-ribose deacetylase (regulator of RNase III)
MPEVPDMEEISEDLVVSLTDREINEKTPYVDIELTMGDITQIDVDAVVNAAHDDLTGGGGVDGAIHKAAGQKLLGECLNLYGCPQGEARITGAYDMPSKYIIHTVGPVWSPSLPPDIKLRMLSDCYTNCLLLAESQGLKSIAFPCISTGAYCFPKDLASTCAIETIKKFFNDRESTYIDEVYIVCFDKQNFEEYEKILI